MSEISSVYILCIDNRISSGSKVFYIYILECLNYDINNCFEPVSMDYLCNLFQCSLRSLYNWIKELCDNGYLKYKDNRFMCMR